MSKQRHMWGAWVVDEGSSHGYWAWDPTAQHAEWPVAFCVLRRQIMPLVKKLREADWVVSCNPVKVLVPKGPGG